MPLLSIVPHAIAGTPMWVWGLLAALVVLGLIQLRTRAVHEVRLVLLPLAMAAYSFYGLTLLFGFTVAGVVAWAAGLAMSVGVGIGLGRLAGARYLQDTRRFVVPGSWIPLAVMLALFLSRYVVAVSLAMHPDLRQVAEFAFAASLASGLLGGFFPARAVRVWSQRRAD
ncbi:MAG: DUF6622 family protein [Burkholderiales bacterium]